MTDPGIDAPESGATAAPAPEATPARRRWPDRVISATPVFAALALLLIVVGAIVVSIPVENPKVQDCGAPVVFVLTGRPDVYVDPANPPKGLTAAQARATNDHRCQSRVAARAVPGGILVASGLVIGILAAIVEWLARAARRRDDIALGTAAATAPPGPPMPAPPAI